MKNKKNLIILAIILFIALVTSGVIAYYSTSVDVTKKIKMGVIDVELKTFVEINGNIIEYTSNDLELTNERFSYIPMVYNKTKSGDCYIRVKTYLNSDNDSEVVDPNHVYNLNANVMYGSDGYFYYKSIVSPSSNVKIYDGLVLDSLNNYTSGNLKVVSVVEAIQAQNFDVNFISNTPWGDLSNIEIKALQVSNNIGG